MYTRSELATLAQIYIEATAVSPSALAVACSGNAKLFRWLFSGGDIKASSAEQASDWFDKNWPLHVEWPAAVKRRSYAGLPKLGGRRRRRNGDTATATI